MPQEIDRNEVRRLMREGAQVVEVLPKEEFEADHLPGAIRRPLREPRGGSATRPRARDVARADVPTCRPEEPMRAVRARAAAARWDACVVVNDERVVLGLLRAAELRKDDEERVDRVMRPGPSTLRPYAPIDDIAKFMATHDLPNCPITTSDGRLVGLLRREDLATLKS